jgi:hypothetical protein
VEALSAIGKLIVQVPEEMKKKEWVLEWALLVFPRLLHDNSK